MDYAAIIRPILTVLLPAIFTRIVTMGYISPAHATVLQNWLMDGLCALPAALSYAYLVWKGTAVQKIASVNRLPDVDKVVVTDAALAAAVNQPGVVLKSSPWVAAFVIFLVVAPLMGCITTLASVDAKVRDKCNYLVSGVAIARLGASFYPGATLLVANGSSLIDAYCSGAPIKDTATALAKMEDIIVAVRPIAAQINN